MFEFKQLFTNPVFVGFVKNKRKILKQNSGVQCVMMHCSKDDQKSGYIIPTYASNSWTILGGTP